MLSNVEKKTRAHALEPVYPEAVQRYVDLSRFYDLTAAKSEREEIIGLSKEIQSAYRRAFHSLKAARQVEMEASASAARSFDREHAERRFAGIAARELRHRRAGTGTTSVRFLGGATRKGYVWQFESVSALAGKVYELEDEWELSGNLLKSLHTTAIERGWDTIVCMAPESPERIEHLLIPDLSLAFVTSRPGMQYPDKPFRRIRINAMARPSNRARIHFESRMVRLLREDAVASLQNAGELHDKLEAVYHPYVNFDGVTALAALEAGRLLSWMS